MSHPIIKTACVVAGFAVAALAATSAYAAKPLSVKQKNEMAEAMARNHQQTNARARAKAPVKTMAQAAETRTVLANGMVGMQVPEELHNYLTVQYDADGNPRVVETDGTAQPTLNTAETSNEK